MKPEHSLPRNLLIPFLAVVIVVAIALGGLGWYLFEQEQALETQRVQDRLEDAAEVAVTNLRSRLVEVQSQLRLLVALQKEELVSDLSRHAQVLSEGALLASLGDKGVEAYPAGRLLYYPVLPEKQGIPGNTFAGGEVFEFRQKDYVRAIIFFRQLARTSESTVRAGALLRLARNLRKNKQVEEALAVYEELERLGPLTVAQLPADLLARHARLSLLGESNQEARRRQEAQDLYTGLNSGRWRISSASYQFYTRDVETWLGLDSGSDASFRPAPPSALALAEAVEYLWKQWLDETESSDVEHVRQLWFGDEPVLMIWQKTDRHLLGLVGGKQYLQQDWMGDLERLQESRNGRLAITDERGRAVLEPLEDGIRQAVRTGAQTGLPWTIHLASADPERDLEQQSTRRRVLVTALLLVVLLVGGSGYVGVRALNRELEVSQLKSDFVSAVSHEFRTPLTSLRQLTELLVSGRVSEPGRSARYHQVLKQQTEKLYRMVETLLDFGRMEAGTFQYRPELLDVHELVRENVEDFRRQIEDRGYQVQLSSNGSDHMIRADREALKHVLWNLLDNAAKYSPDCKTIWVEVERQERRLAIRVRDRGLGIAPGEQSEIFSKFVRGSAAESTGRKGSGIGLALAHSIVEGHGGQLVLDSQPGVGSTFSVLLPLESGNETTAGSRG